MCDKALHLNQYGYLILCVCVIKSPILSHNLLCSSFYGQCKTTNLLLGVNALRYNSM